jgi:hypothetical protein
LLREEVVLLLGQSTLLQEFGSDGSLGHRCERRQRRDRTAQLLRQASLLLLEKACLLWS